MEFDYRRLKSGWIEGRRDREDALQLMFMAWMHWADPPFLTGLEDDSEARTVWMAVFDYFGGEKAKDPEFLFVAGLMAGIFPWQLGDEHAWAGSASRMTARSLALVPQGFSPKAFEGRGEYGDYFAHHASSPP